MPDESSRQTSLHFWPICSASHGQKRKPRRSSASSCPDWAPRLRSQAFEAWSVGMQGATSLGKSRDQRSRVPKMGETGATWCHSKLADACLPYIYTYTRQTCGQTGRHAGRLRHRDTKRHTKTQSHTYTPTRTAFLLDHRSWLRASGFGKYLRRVKEASQVRRKPSSAAPGKVHQDGTATHNFLASMLCKSRSRSKLNFDFHVLSRHQLSLCFQELLPKPQPARQTLRP